jgi:hypothetical protein
MPGIKTLGKLFFKKNASGKSAYVAAVARVFSAANRKENNPAQIEAGERTSHRAQ